MQQSFLQLFQRDFQKLYKEIELYKDESKIWEIMDGTSNSGGNLALHLMGNLNTYFGKNLRNTGYVRNREAEFSDRNIPKERLLKSIEEVNQVVSKVLKNLTDEQMKAIYPENVLGYEMTTEYFLIHLHGHLTYHTGQINYHRRGLVNNWELIENSFRTIRLFSINCYLFSNSVLPINTKLPFSRQRHFLLGQE